MLQRGKAMGINQLEKIVIDDEDIKWVESAMRGNVQFNQERVNIIKNMESIDIQAFPGSGKTTVLVAKLAILAKKWPFANMGICVLSHTNVAREEIKSRLGNSEVGKKLLTYPHFVGTLHSFFDTYVSLPWLRSKGIKLNIIDTDIVRKARWYSLPNNTRSYLEKQYEDERICTYRGSIGNISWDKNGDTRKILIDTISKSQEQGNFTFEEMLLYAKEALLESTSISSSIQQRFPIAFIDEAQDTDSFQWELLQTAFSGDGVLSIRQGYGDSNQAIYSNVSIDDACVQFPRMSPLFLSESKRFDSKLAILANTVVLSTEQMEGTDNIFSKRGGYHTIFLFSRDKAGQVVNEFGQLVLDVFSDEELSEYKKEGCHVIGMVHDKKEETQEKHFPKGIYDYWPLYEAKHAKKRTILRYLIEYFREGKLAFEQEYETGEQIEWISKGLRRLINLAKEEVYFPATGNSFASIIKSLPEDRQNEFRNKIVELTEIDYVSKANWNVIIMVLKDILKLFDVSVNQKVSSFWQWTEDIGTDIPVDNVEKKVLPNHYIYTDKKTKRTVDLEFGSIHSVKGRTHLATLVLETYLKTHNMKSILKYLCDTPPKKIGTNHKRLKCQYVAMTRARALLCLAIPVEFVNEKCQEKLANLGWKIKVL